jgi:glucokinase
MTLTVAVEVGIRQIRAILLDPFDQDNHNRIPVIQNATAKETNIGQLSADPDLVDIVVDIASEVAGKNRGDVEAVGVSCAAAVDRFGRISLASAERQRALDEFKRPLTIKLRALFSNPDLRVAVANGANMAAWGEYKLGRGREMHANDLVFIIVGSTVGAAVIGQGTLNVGHWGFAGQFGHMLADTTSTKKCAVCNHTGCLSSVSGGSAILTRLAERKAEPDAVHLIDHLVKHPTPKSEDAGQKIVIDGATLDARAVVEAAKIEDPKNQRPKFPLALKLVLQSAEPLGATIGRLVCLLDPFVVVVGGIFSNAAFLEEPLAQTARELIPSFRRGNTHLLLSQFSDFAQDVEWLCGDEAALYGAACWVWDNRE